MEHGEPSEFWIIYTVADTGYGSFAYLFPCLQQHTNIQNPKHNKGKKAIKIRHANICI